MLLAKQGYQKRMNMKNVNKLSTKNYLLAAMIATGLTACVTINIYFPAAAAEKAAEKIVDEVWQLKEEGAKVNVDTAPAETEPAK